MEDKLKQIKKRLNDLAPNRPGPSEKWEFDPDPSYYGLICTEDGCAIANVAENKSMLAIKKYGDYPVHVGEFIANAPTDIEFLLNLVESLQAKINKSGW